MIREWRIKTISKIISDVFFVDNAQIDICYTQGRDFPDSISIYLDRGTINEKSINAFKARICEEEMDFEYYICIYDDDEWWISLRFIGMEQ